MSEKNSNGLTRTAKLIRVGIGIVIACIPAAGGAQCSMSETEKAYQALQGRVGELQEATRIMEKNQDRLFQLVIAAQVHEDVAESGPELMDPPEPRPSDRRRPRAGRRPASVPESIHENSYIQAPIPELKRLPVDLDDL